MFSPQYFIVIEQAVFIECKTMKNAIFTLFAVHFVFNLEYNIRVKDFYRFLQEYLMNIPEGSKRSVNSVWVLNCFFLTELFTFCCATSDCIT